MAPRHALARSVRRLGDVVRAKVGDRRRRTHAGGDTALRVVYEPALDGDADPGEVVWGWVPYEDDPTQGKDRPLVVVGRRGARLVAVPLTSRRDDRDAQVAIGSGPWDRAGRPSYARVDRLVDLDPSQVRREGAILPRDRFDVVVAEVIRRHRTDAGRRRRVP